MSVLCERCEEREAKVECVQCGRGEYGLDNLFTLNFAWTPTPISKRCPILIANDQVMILD